MMMLKTSFCLVHSLIDITIRTALVIGVSYSAGSTDDILLTHHKYIMVVDTIAD